MGLFRSSLESQRDAAAGQPHHPAGPGGAGPAPTYSNSAPTSTATGGHPVAPSPAATPTGPNEHDRQGRALTKGGHHGRRSSLEERGSYPGAGAGIGGGGGHAFSEHDSLSGAQTKLKAAQEAEAAADAALKRARTAVKEAHAEIAALEQEAEAEARAAREKQEAAKSVRREGDKLGRFL
ncbi:hypothetical protein JCM8202_004207 [Rhodotorula sphaerocarpa]